MRYAAIRKMDISNGEGLGVALFVQGCHFHCKNCFNKETWDFNGGNKLTFKEIEELLHQLSKPQYTRLSILGGEPLAKENRDGVSAICKFVKEFIPDKKIWLYTGNKAEDIGLDLAEYSRRSRTNHLMYDCRLEILPYIDVLVDGQYVDELKDMSYPWAGSTNQRVIDVQKSLERNVVVLWKDTSNNLSTTERHDESE